MRFGLALPHYDFSLPGSQSLDWNRIKDWAQAAQELGFDSIWVSDHLFWDLSKYGGPSIRQSTLECWTALSALASVTSTVRLGSLVLCNDLRNPALVAKMAATVDVLSGGRLEVGLGAGWYEPEYEAAGISFESAATRIERLGEALQVIIGLLTQPSFTFTGRHYKTDEAVNNPQPVQVPRPPIFVGGKGDRVVKTAAKYADGFNTAWAWTPGDFGGRVKLLRKEAEAAGRDPNEIWASVGLYALSGPDDAGIQGLFDRYLQSSPIPSSGMSLEQWRRDKLVGTPEEIRSQVAEYERQGAREVILGFGLLPFQIADEAAVEWFAREVIPLCK